MEDQNNNDKDGISKNAFAMFIESQKLIIREMMHEHRDLAREAAENHKEEMSRNKRLAILLTIISILVAGLSVTIGAVVGVQQLNLSRLYKREGWLESRINHWVIRDDELMSAMVNIRDVRDEGQMQCQNGQYVGADPSAYRRRLKNANYKLISAAYGIKNTFNEEIQKKTTAFISSSSLSTEICVKGAANDDDLRVKQNEINDLILSSINKLKQQRNAIMDRIEGVENDKEKTIVETESKQ